MVPRQTLWACPLPGQRSAVLWTSHPKVCKIKIQKKHEPLFEKTEDVKSASESDGLDNYLQPSGTTWVT